jgi:hypothetical protein
MTETINHCFEISNKAELFSMNLTHVHRTGWLGVWDALKAAITRDGRWVVSKPVQISFWVQCTNCSTLAKGYVHD